MKLSVWVITYNHRGYIEQCLRSILNQKVDCDYEIVIGEDCSNDGTREIVSDFHNRYRDRIKVIYNENNLGGRANLLQTVAACTGEYIAFVEGDDYWTSVDKLRMQVEFLDKHRQASCVFHRARAVNAADPAGDFVIPATDPPQFSSFDFLVQDSNPIAVNSLMARRSCLADIDVWLSDVRPGDWLMCMMLATKGDIGFIPLEMSHYRLHAAGHWQSLNLHQRLGITVRMLRHASTLVGGDAKARVEEQIKRFLTLWSREIVHNPGEPLDLLQESLDNLKDPALTKDLLLQVAAAGREAGVELRLMKKDPYNRLRARLAKMLPPSRD